MYIYIYDGVQGDRRARIGETMELRETNGFHLIERSPGKTILGWDPRYIRHALLVNKSID